MFTSIFARSMNLLTVLALIAPIGTAISAEQRSLARVWNEAMLYAIRHDFARPTTHARNLFHASAAMYDTWAVYNPPASPYFLGKTQANGFHCEFSDEQRTAFIDAAPSDTERQKNIETALTAAAYHLMSHRFELSPGATLIRLHLNDVLDELGTTVNHNQTPVLDNPEGLGSYLAKCIIEYGLSDGANETNQYKNSYYQPVNAPLSPSKSGNPTISNPDRWQPLNIDNYVDQSGNPLPMPDFLGAEWGNVEPFALTTEDSEVKQRDGQPYRVYLDPGEPSLFANNATDFAWGHSMVATWSSHLDPSDGVMWDISPAAIGASAALPDNNGLKGFYRYIAGGTEHKGRTSNPVTGKPYSPNNVLRGDYTRVLAEYWADGPDSETPPGHWFTILNDYVLDHPEFQRRYCGAGEEIDELEFDIRSYFVLGGAMHDAAIAAWSVKGYYDYVRPVSALRYLAKRGQSSDPNLPGYDKEGIPLVKNMIEVVQKGDVLANSDGTNIGKIKVRAWRGPEHIGNRFENNAGVDWILLENWWPYQRPTFITPPFSGYVSGHSTFSRAAAEVLTVLTGSEYFPGGLAEFLATKNEFLVFEQGPSEDVTLQWATFQDASDQSSLSRIWGGIHPPVDDVPGRKIGIKVAQRAVQRAASYFTGNPATFINDKNINDFGGSECMMTATYED